MRLLLVEDDNELAKLLESLLKSNDYVIDLAENLAIARAAVLDNEYDIILLDRMLPDGEGLELLRFCKSKNIQTRVLVLSALNELGDRVDGLDLGADDYLAKPFEPEELLARLRASLRHPLEQQERLIEAGNLTYNTKQRDLQINGEPLILPRREMLVIELLLRRFKHVVTREAIESSIYGYDDEILSNSLESHISKLRKNLSSHETGLTIHTVRGVGYMLSDNQ